MEYLSTIFTVEWLAHNSINIHTIEDIDQLYVTMSNEYKDYLASDHANNFKVSTLQSIKDFLKGKS